MNKSRVCSAEELEAVLARAERGDRILAIAMEDEPDGPKGIGVDIVALDDHNREYHVCFYAGDLESEGVIRDFHGVLEDVWPNMQKAALLALETLEAVREQAEEDRRNEAEAKRWRSM